MSCTIVSRGTGGRDVDTSLWRIMGLLDAVSFETESGRQLGGKRGHNEGGSMSQVAGSVRGGQESKAAKPLSKGTKNKNNYGIVGKERSGRKNGIEATPNLELRGEKHLKVILGSKTR